MRKEYDFSKMRLKKNPYARRLKQQVTMRLDKEIVEYFKRLGQENDIPYQSLINLYLKDCVRSRKKPTTIWKSVS